jgi:hypothetical protein
MVLVKYHLFFSNSLLALNNHCTSPLLLDYNSYIINFAILKYNLVTFGIFTDLCKHHQNLILEHSHHPERNPIPFCSHSHLFCLSQP